MLACMPLYGQDSVHSELILAQLFLDPLPTVCPTDLDIQFIPLAVVLAVALLNWREPWLTNDELK